MEKTGKKEIVIRKLDIPEDKIQEYKESFDFLDKDKNGTISPDEIYLSFKNSGYPLTKEEIKEIVDDLDTNGDGEISFEEFITLMYKAISERSDSNYNSENKDNKIENNRGDNQENFNDKLNNIKEEKQEDKENNMQKSEQDNNKGDNLEDMGEKHTDILDISKKNDEDNNQENKQEEQEEEDPVIKAFETFDVDNSGYITNVEFKHILTKLGVKLTENEVDLLFKKCDLDNDGRLNYKVFVKFWRRR